MAEQYLTTKQVADMFQVTPRTVVKWAENGTLPGYKVGDLWRFNKAEIEEHIKQQRAKQQEENSQS